MQIYGIEADEEIEPYTGNFQYYQNDYAYVKYGSSTIARCGCGPTAMAMVATALSGKRITPETIVKWCGNSYYIPGSGTSWSLFAAAAKHFNLNCTVISTTSSASVVSALKAGNLVISSQRPGLFTSGGHFIVLVRYNSDNTISVMDPNKRNAVSRGYNNRHFKLSEIHNTSKNYWIFRR